MDPHPDHGEGAGWEEGARLVPMDVAWEDVIEETDYITQAGQAGHRGGTQASRGTQHPLSGQASGGASEAGGSTMDTAAPGEYGECAAGSGESSGGGGLG
ncbi:hypothetical protein CYMTET_4864 [Cymbomonas tetramitiformis]|uniref:Uncharacterized protein n=1 Tax=Cymbomonas tetramitiformis TaxID=36881 RepID=A0AAE0H0L0_9CHLO|nr:hypothetical protein CYMTET_4864 [Cymbomonas tetramitiformis]